VTLTKLIRAGLLAGAFLAPSMALADTESQSFIRRAIEGNVAEVQVGLLAQQKGTTPAVKEFGRMLVEDHNKANQQAEKAAKSLGVSVATATTSGRASTDDMLAKEPAKQFETDLVNKLLQQHQNTIDDYQKAATNLKDEAGRYASDQLPVLQRHLTRLQQIAHELGI
jgi:putative membrane protein